MSVEAGPRILPRGDLTGTNLGRYRVLAKLGEGGMGEVYRAEDTLLRRAVALKRLAPALASDEAHKRRLLREARSVSALSHPNIATLFDVFESSGETFLVMELVAGESLRARLTRPLALGEAIRIMRQCAEALEAAHRAGIVHRDVKPENISLAADGHVKILDFGIAQRLPLDDTGTATTETATLRGTPRYLAPEVLQQAEPDARADIFSLGVVFYEMLTGRHPFESGTMASTIARILTETPPPPSRLNSAVPPEVDRMVGKMLARDPAARYPSAADLLRDIDRAARLTPAALPTLRRRPVVIGLVAVSALLVVFLVWWLSVGFPRKIPAEPKLAILPFASMDNSAESQAVGRGIQQTLAVRLAQLSPRVQVYPPVITHRGPAGWEEIPVDSPAAARQAGANLTLGGSVQVTDGQVRIRYTLTNIEIPSELGGDILEGDRRDLSSLEERVALSAVGLLQLAGERELKREAQVRKPAVSEAYEPYVQGRGHLESSDQPEGIESAIAAFNRALALDPGFAPAYAGLGVAYWKKYQSTKDVQYVATARQACEQAVRLDAGLAFAHICLGTIHQGTGQYEKSLAEFQLARESEPTNDDAYVGLARAQEQLGRMEAAEQTYRQAIDLRPGFWAGYTWLGTFYVRQGRYGEALQQFARGAVLAPNNDRAHFSLGGIYIYLGRYEDAVHALQRAIEIRPTFQAYSNLGTAYMSLRRWEEAILAFEQATRLNSERYVIWGNLARAYYSSPGKRAQARAASERAIQLGQEQLAVNPRDPDPHILLASYYAMLGQKPEAFRHLQRALSMRGDDPEFLFWAAVVHNQFGDRAQALTWLEKAVAKGYSLADIRAAVELDNLHDDPKFRRIVGGKPD